MPRLTTAREDGDETLRSRPIEPVMTLTEQGLVLGAATVLVKARRNPEGLPGLAIAGSEERILALLALAYGEPVGPRVVGTIRRAAKYWSQGETGLASIALALSGPPPLEDEERASFRLFLADQLLADGLSPRQLMKACGLDTAPLDALKAGFNPDEPRVPAGNPDGGQWAGGGTEPKFPSAVTAGPHPISYKVVHGLPGDAVAVTSPDGSPIKDPDSSTGNLMGPRHADYRQVYAGGLSTASAPLPIQLALISAALGQGGTYDFQRNSASQQVYPAYANASNYAVGVYMAGAGFSLWQTHEIAQAYALVHSSNYGSKKQYEWTTKGWEDATAGRWR
jgi:hypothetical protein